MPTRKLYFISLKLERLARLVEGILTVSSTLKEITLTGGYRYIITHQLSDRETWDCGEIEIKMFQKAPERLQSLLHLEEIDKETLSLWTELSVIQTEGMTNESKNHQGLLFNRILEAVPPGIFVIPEIPSKIGVAQDLLKLGSGVDLSVTSEILSKLNDHRPFQEGLSKSSKEDQPRKGRRPLRDDEIAFETVRHVLSEVNSRRQKNPSKLIKEIEREIDEEFQVAPRTLRDWRRKYTKIIGL